METCAAQFADVKSVAMVTVKRPVPVSVMLVTLYADCSVGVPADTVTAAQNLVWLSSENWLTSIVPRLSHRRPRYQEGKLRRRQQ